MRLDVALVHRLGVELALNHDIGLGEAGGDVPERELDALGDVGRLRRPGLDADRVHLLMQQRRIGLHCPGHVQHVRQQKRHKQIVDPQY
jgi:hypothetical protein